MLSPYVFFLYLSVIIFISYFLCINDKYLSRIFIFVIENYICHVFLYQWWIFFLCFFLIFFNNKFLSCAFLKNIFSNKIFCFIFFMYEEQILVFYFSFIFIRDKCMSCVCIYICVCLIFVMCVLYINDKKNNVS